MNTKLGTEVAHDTRDSDTTFKVKRSKVKVTRPLSSPPCWRVKQLQRWAWERVGRGKLLLRCRLLGRERRFGAHAERRGAGHIVAAARPPTACFPSMHTEPENRSEKFQKFQTRFPESFEKPTYLTFALSYTIVNESKCELLCGDSEAVKNFRKLHLA